MSIYLEVLNAFGLGNMFISFIRLCYIDVLLIYMVVCVGVYVCVCNIGELSRVIVFVHN